MALPCSSSGPGSARRAPRRDDDRGTRLVEYALLLALIAIVCLVAVNLIGGPASEGLSSGGDGFAS